MCRFAPEISADKEENRRNPDGFQDFLTQSSGNLWREAVCGDFISGSLILESVLYAKAIFPSNYLLVNAALIETLYMLHNVRKSQGGRPGKSKNLYS